jgi:hypothetical protein
VFVQRRPNGGSQPSGVEAANHTGFNLNREWLRRIIRVNEYLVEDSERHLELECHA